MTRTTPLFSPLLFTFILMLSGYSSAQTVSDDLLTEQISARSWQILNDILGEVGARPAGSEQEKQVLYGFTARHWHQTSGIPVNSQPVTFKQNDSEKRSANVWITFPGVSDKHIIIGAHADSTGEDEGSQGATDNGVAVALLLGLGEKLHTIELQHTVTLVLFGAEEPGLFGAKAFTTALLADSHWFTKAPFPTAMINLDTIAGGDHLYIHSPTQKTYKLCAEEQSYNSSTQVRDSLLSVAQTAGLPFALHPTFPDFPSGETGGWSDHAPFACAGIAVGYIEATNFSIKGRDGYDGYSQALHPSLWTCLDTSQKTSCAPEQEQQWGRIWHTSADRLDVLNKLYPQRLRTQLNAVTQLLLSFLAGDKQPPQHSD